ncbi:hypothetical protein [Iningainema tapete]|uniref:Uncharacterized protein n=1 Tax=Iningainema tapete BLCC-T55 TaxID=2748662 RepID=A0A8J6XCM4_9CYAN|nr:hypothetical protein [Iningainema tapete]MBD2772569.1 hypothetical protein [Iningainema tapete BLCC-T55]
MKAIVCDGDILKSLDPRQVAVYLQSKGWHERTRVPAQVSSWTRDTFSEDKLKIYLPLDQDFDDYPRRMYEVMEILEKAENRSQLDILSELITVARNIEIQGLVTQVQPSAELKSGNITIQGIVVDKLRKIHIQLSEPEYSLALLAYSERLPIICTGDLIKEGDSFVLKNLHNFGLYPEEATN